MTAESLPADFSSYRSAIRRRRLRLGTLLLVLLGVTAIWRITVGEWDIPLAKVAGLLAFRLPEALSGTPEALVIRSVRLPRFLAAAGAGGLLSVAGVVLQGLLANPLAEPYTLGIAAGAAFGGAIGFFIDPRLVMPLAFFGSLSSLWLVSLISWKSGSDGTRLVLSGIIVSSILSAGVTFLKAIADERLGPIVLWLMGSFAGASQISATAVLLAGALIFSVAWLYGRQLDVMSGGEGGATLLCVNERRMRAVLLYSASLGTAIVVSYFGIIGFVGLVVPHMIRILIGPLHRPLLLLSFIAGALLLAVADGLAQHMSELPVGVVTALLGGPFFCHLLATRRAGK